MDRRKCQIQNKVHEITEERSLLQSYLDKIINQVHECVDFLNTSKKIKPKDCTLVLKYELEVLKKITEMNFELECIIDQSPLDQLKAAVFDDYSNALIKQVDPKRETSLNVVEKQEPIVRTISQQSELNDVACSSIQCPESIETCNTEVETESNFSDADIQVLRETLKKFSVKLGLNPEYISSLADIYQKPSSNGITEYFDIPSHSQNKLVSTNVDLGNATTSGFDIPEKDTNKIFSSRNESKENCYDALQNIEASTLLEKDDAPNSSFDTIHDLHLIKDIKKNVPKRSESEEEYTANGSSSDSIGNMSESSLSEECVTNETNHCLIPLVNEHSIVIGNIADEGHTKTDNGETSTNKAICTALEKLNNIKFFDRQTEAVAKMQSVNHPDISLKPTDIRIKNNFEANNKKPKKKNKKNKCADNEFYELMPKSTLQRGMDCAFCHVESPNEFYIHIVDKESVQIDNLTQQLNALFTNTVSKYSTKEEAFNAIGTFCCSFASSYNSWYRAQVLNWELESKSEEVLVQFVDYGDKRRTSYKNLRRMNRELAELPMLAVRCHLALMYPPQSTVTNRLTAWPTATIEALMNLSGLLPHGKNDRDKIFRIVYASREENSISIDLYNLEDDEEHTVGQILLDLGLAEQIIDEYDSEHPELDVYLQDVDALETADNINEAVMGYDPKDEVRICRFTKSDGTCYKGKNCKLEHVPLSKDGFTTDKLPIFKEAMYSLAFPAKGELVNVLITAYKDVCHFFAQIIWKPHKEKNYMIDEDLYMLLADMNMARTVRAFETFKIAPAIGEIVIVWHLSNKWLRAVVREEVMENDGQLKYKVFTLDFGECLTVPLNALRKIKPHFLQLPFQAVECYLSNSIAKEDCDKKKAKNFFTEKLYYHNFVAHTMSVSLPLKVEIKTFDGRNIGKMLIEEGFAENRLCDFNLIDNNCMELC